MKNEFVPCQLGTSPVSFPKKKKGGPAFVVLQDISGSTEMHNIQHHAQQQYPICLDFNSINNRAKVFSKHIKEREEEITALLLRYECYEVAVDEMERTIDLLQNLSENAEYFQREVGAVTSFLPRNQPLYALACFAIIPSLMAKEVHVRAPQAMHSFFFDLTKELHLSEHFPNLHVSTKSREEFVTERSALQFNKETDTKEPVTEVVIFTGTMKNADSMRQLFDRKILFIANGSGHNPIVVTETANTENAIDSTLRVQLYNQGQDCAGPNAVLVHKKQYKQFVAALKTKVKNVTVGPYAQKENIVGPIGNRKDLRRIQDIFVENAEWIDPSTKGVIHTQSVIVEPTIILKPLCEGGNFDEQFAPIFFVQQYENDQQLCEYFEDPRYENNAMYITLFGESPYIEQFVGHKTAGGKILHDAATIIRNTNLHAPGVERGTRPYGGYGRGASCISVNGTVIAKPTLPQRDIFEQLVLPTLQKEQHRAKRMDTQSIDTVVSKQKDMNKGIGILHTLHARSTKQIQPSELYSSQRHWGAILAQKVVDAFPDEDVYTCSAGISPSETTNLNHLREIMISWTVANGLKDLGKNVRLVLSWNDFDGLRTVPKHADAFLKQYIGVPMSSIPDPLGQYTSYTRRISEECDRALAELGIKVEHRYQTTEYQSGRYDQHIINALQHREEIANINQSYTSDEEKMPSPYFPIKIYSRFTGEDTTQILEYDGDRNITYLCLATGETDTIDILEHRIAKLHWNVDWSMRWGAEKIQFEPGGHYLGMPGGSYDIASDIAQTVFKTKPPVFIGYQSVQTKKLNTDSNTLSLSKALEIYEPDILRWLFAKTPPNQRMNIPVDNDIYAQYNAFDEERSTWKKGDLPEARSLSLEWSSLLKDGKSLINAVAFKQVVTLGQTAQWNKQKFLELLGNTANNNGKKVGKRLQKAKIWMEKLNENQLFQVRSHLNTTYATTMAEESIQHVQKLRQALVEGLSSIEELEQHMYNIPKDALCSEKENRSRQRIFFKDVYNLIFGTDKGPRLPTFFWAAESAVVLPLLEV